MILKGLPHNRSRVYNADQLAVEYKEFPNANRYADDYVFGFAVFKQEEARRHRPLPPKRDSILRCNMAVAVSPYRYDAMMHQSPLNVRTENNQETFWSNADQSALVFREVSHTAFQYPFALAQQDCMDHPEWVKILLEGIAQLSGVAGGHTHSFYEFAPRSVVARLTPKLVAGYDTYGFNEEGDFPELMKRLGAEEGLPGNEFWMGGEIVRNLTPADRTRLETVEVHLYSNPDLLFDQIAEAFLGNAENVPAP